MGFKQIQAARAILFERISLSRCDGKREGEIITKYLHRQQERCMFARIKNKVARRARSMVPKIYAE